MRSVFIINTLIVSIFLLQSCNVKEVKKEFYKEDPSKIFSESEMKNNLKDGIEKRFYKNGKVSQIDFYKNDTLNGFSTIFREDGSVSQKIPFIKGMRQGAYSFFYKNGNISETGFFKNNYKRGKIFIYDEYDSGHLKMEVYALHNKEDEFEYYRKQYDDKGHLIRMRKNIHLEYDSNGLVAFKKNTIKISLDEFLGPYDSAVVIMGDFDSPFFYKEVSNAIKVPKDRSVIFYDYVPKIQGKTVIRGAWIHYKKDIVADTLREYTNVGLFEDSVVVH